MSLRRLAGVSKARVPDVRLSVPFKFRSPVVLRVSCINPEMLGVIVPEIVVVSVSIRIEVACVILLKKFGEIPGALKVRGE
jgi:hypothetical protein